MIVVVPAIATLEAARTEVRSSRTMNGKEVAAWVQLSMEGLLAARSSEHESQERKVARLTKQSIKTLPSDLLRSVLDVLSILSLYSMALSCKRHAKHTTPLLRHKKFVSTENGMQITMYQRAWSRMLALPGKMWATRLHMCDQQRMRVKIRSLDHGNAQVYLKSDCVYTGTIELQASVRLRLLHDDLSIELEPTGPLTDEIARFIGTISLVVRGQPAGSTSDVTTKKHDLLWNSEVAQDNTDGPLLLRPRQQDGFQWMPPGGTWVRGTSDAIESLLKDDIWSALEDPESQSEEPFDIGEVWIRDVRGVHEAAEADDAGAIAEVRRSGHDAEDVLCYLNDHGIFGWTL